MGQRAEGGTSDRDWVTKAVRESPGSVGVISTRSLLLGMTRESESVFYTDRAYCQEKKIVLEVVRPLTIHCSYHNYNF